MDRLTLAQNLAKAAGDVVLRWYDKENVVIAKGEKDFALIACCACKQPERICGFGSV